MPNKRKGGGERGRKGKRKPTGDYPVGNCRPPAEHQFRKGEPSPNPAGRPRGKPKTPLEGLALNPALAKVLALARETIKVNGEDVSVIDAAFKQLTRLALVQQREKSLHKLIDMHTTAQQGVLDHKLEMIGYAIQYKEKWGPVFAQCEANGNPVPNVLPHPDDIIIDVEGGVTIVGAYDEESKKIEDLRVSELHKRLKVIAQIRDAFGPQPKSKETDTLLRRLEREAARLNNLLPPRLQVQSGIKRSEALADVKRTGRRKRAERPAERRWRRHGGKGRSNLEPRS